jgi:acetyl-CoA carboxylase biotin carboxyl carrier protein
VKHAEAVRVLDWAQGTDLVEVSFRRGDDRFAFALGPAPAPPASGPRARFPDPRRAPVPSPGVGYWHAGPPGRTARIQAGTRVAAGGSLGWLEAGPDRREVKSPAAGTVAEVLVEEGAAVQYGQPLFLLERDG